MGTQGFHDGGHDGHARVEGADHILKDGLHLGAKRPEFLALHVGDVPAVEHDRAGVGLQEAQDQTSGGGFARSALPTSPQVSPWRMSKETPSTARSTVARARKAAVVNRKCLRRSVAVRRAAGTGVSATPSGP